jgi:tRNA U38,U39,U40 pseudouridine synthase TruA
MSSWLWRQGLSLAKFWFRAEGSGMASASAREAELRAMSKEELVQLALRHMPASPDAPQKQRTAIDASGQDILLPPAECSPTEGPPRKRQRKVERAFDMSRYGQRMIALKFCYLGWHFHGLASQPHTESSVEDHLFHSLLRSRLIESRETCDFSRAGRTDIGVSALGQVVGLRVRSNILNPSTGTEELDYAKMINSGLPKEIRVLCWAPVSDEIAAAVPEIPATPPDPEVRRPGQAFSARFDAIHRSYKYFFLRGGLDIDAMQEAGQCFVGRHDFRNFCKIDVDKVKNFERVMYDVEVRRFVDDSPPARGEASRDGEFTQYYLFVRGQAFLWHQIRCMAAVLFEVGRGNEKPDIVRRMLEDATTGVGHFSNGKPSYQMAPATPLLLYECAYPPSVVSFKVPVPKQLTVMQASFGRADAEIGHLCAEAAAQTAVARSMLDWNDSMPCVPVVSSGDDAVREYGEIREPRALMPGHPSGRLQSGVMYIPFDKRKQESTVEEKRRKLLRKKPNSSLTDNRERSFGEGTVCASSCSK